MKEHFKILLFKGDRDKVLGKYPVIFNNEFGGCNIPQLMTINTTIRDLEKLYSNLNFKEVKLTLVTLQEFQTDKT